MNTTYFLRKVLTGKRIRDSINVSFDKTKSENYQIIINNLYNSVRGSVHCWAYGRQQYEAGITRDYSAIMLPMLRRTCDY